MEKQLYNARPEIIQQLVRLLHNDSEAGLSLKTNVLITLRTLARNSIFATNRRSEHSRFHQILNALDSNLNHGILMTLLRENVAFLQANDPSTEEMHYAQALHRLIREFLESPQGASNLGFAGIVPLIVEVMKFERSSVYHIVTTVADLMATLLPHQRHNQLLPLFLEADGLGTVIRVIKVSSVPLDYSNISVMWITIFPLIHRKKV
jgi:E3 ubiquitin-protein ligase HUWE1